MYSSGEIRIHFGPVRQQKDFLPLKMPRKEILFFALELKHHETRELREDSKMRTRLILICLKDVRSVGQVFIEF